MTKRQMAELLAQRRFPVQPATRLREFNRLMNQSKTEVERRFNIQQAGA